MGWTDWLKKQQKPVVGIDIGHDCVKAVEVIKNGNAFQVKSAGSVVLPIGDLSNRERRSAVLEAISALYAEHNFSTKRVATGVSGESVIVRILRMPVFDSKDESQLAFAVKEEARDFIPFDLEDVAFDYQRLGKVKVGGGENLEVLIVAVRKELVDDRVALLKEAGLQPAIVDVGSFALMNALVVGKGLNPEAPVGIVHIGAELTTIMITKHEAARFTRDLPLAGNNITNAIVAEMGVTVQEAEQLKREFGLPDPSKTGETNVSASIQVGSGLDSNEKSGFMDGLMDQIDQMTSGASSSETQPNRERVQNICEQFIGDLASEVKRCLLYYENQLDGETVEQILLSGGSAEMQHLSEYFHAALDIPTELVHPFENIQHSFEQAEVLQKGLRFGVGVGLALRGVI